MFILLLTLEKGICYGIVIVNPLLQELIDTQSMELEMLNGSLEGR
jgi:hypothetical protein